MNIYHQNNYRKILTSKIEAAKRIDPKINFQRVAEETNIPKSYISKVLNGRADFHSDQLFKICAYLNFSEEQIDYMSALLEHARCQWPQRKAILKRKIQKLQQENLETSRSVKNATVIAPDSKDLHDYYYDPMQQVVHIALSIPRYQKDIRKLQRDLGIPSSQLRTIVESLEEKNMISRKGERIKVEVWNTHLPKSARVYPTWRDQMRQLSLQKIRVLDPEDAYAFSVVFSAEEQTRIDIQAKFLDFLDEVRNMVGDAKDERCFQMNFDLFPWTAEIK